ncbi:LAQU0S10e04082g1_1 [Lachancea quebecensis]|uniref:LAQU0S10e04082g1_1 n=1 Tax=Lachancea quebecensis TaxID=1654605 RepID=A0A0N7MLY6_9SACH|nr:LAQU0S10e04082g1_1 [Lachancea quebecensis]
MNVNQAIETLKSQPSLEVMSQCLITLKEETRSNIEAAAVIVKHVVLVYPSLSGQVKRLLVSILSSSFLLLTHVMNFISLLQNSTEAKICKRFLIDALRGDVTCLNEYICSYTSSVEKQMLKAIFFGSKLLNALSGEIDIECYLEIMKNQLAEILQHHEVTEEKICTDFFISFMSLHPVSATNVFFGGLVFSESHIFTRYVQLLRGASAFTQRRLQKYMVQFLDSNTSLSSSASIYNILLRTGIRTVGFDTLMGLKSNLLQAIVIYLMTDSELLNLYRYLMGFFTRPDHPEDENVCYLLSVLLERLASAEREQKGHDPLFLDAVTSRLSSQSSEARERTMFIAKQIAGDDLKYESDFTIETPTILKPNTENIDFRYFRVPSGIDANGSSERGFSSSSNIMNNDLASLTLSDDETDGEGLQIVFLKDLVREFELDNKSHRSQVFLLKTTVKLVRQKIDFQLEIQSYSSTLLNIISSLSNTLDEPAFEEWKINALVSLLFVAPEKVADLVRILFGNELSLQQRMSLLSTMGLAARELRGIDDNMILKPQTDFPTKRLPWDEGAEKVKPVSAQSPSIEASPLRGAQVVWKSRKLKDKSSETIAPENRFRKFANKFFYPLAHGWLNGIDMGTYDHMFKKHYLSTMEIILSASFPHHEFRAMYQQMSVILEDAVRQGIEIDAVKVSDLSKLAMQE